MYIEIFIFFNILPEYHNYISVTKTELILHHLKETRRRSTILWRTLPSDKYFWKPDDEAMSALEMVRHVLQADYGWNIIINRGDMSNYQTPWDNRPLLNVQDEIDFAEPYRLEFLNSIKSFSDKELSDITIIHPGNMEKKNLGSYLLRIAYHESVHAGQFMSYLRSMELDRPMIWD